MAEKLGVILLEDGRIDEAEPLLRESAQSLRVTLGTESQFTREAVQTLTRLEELRRGSGKR